MVALHVWVCQLLSVHHTRGECQHVLLWPWAHRPTLDGAEGVGRMEVMSRWPLLPHGTGRVHGGLGGAWRQQARSACAFTTGCYGCQVAGCVLGQVGPCTNPLACGLHRED